MSRATRGPIVLALAAGLSLFAFVTYSIRDFDERTQKQEAVVRGQNALRAQEARLTQERAKLDSRNERDLRERAELRDEFSTIIQLLRRIEKAAQPPPP